MSNFAADNYVDTAGTTLASHTNGVTGGPIQLVTGFTGTGQITASNRARASVTESVVVYQYAGAQALTADCDVIGEVYVASNPTTDSSAAGVCARIQSGAGTFYMARVSADFSSPFNNMGYDLYKCVNGTFTQLQFYNGYTFTPGTNYYIMLSVRGSTLTVSISSNGTNWTVLGNTTDTSITGDGYAGITFYEDSLDSDTTGYQLVSMSAASAVFLYDTFTSVSSVTLASHTPNAGGTWVQGTASTDNAPMQISPSHHCRATNSSVNACYTNNIAPSSANYSVTGTLGFSAYTAGDQIGVLARYNSVTDTGYLLITAVGGGAYYLLSRVNGTVTGFFQTINVAPTSGDVFTLSVNGSTITATINGTPYAYTDTTVSVAGYAGVQSNISNPSNSLGPYLSNLTAENSAPISSPVSIAPNNAAWANSPGNWVVNSSQAVSTDYGAKRTISFTGSTTCTLNFSTAALVAAGISTASYPYIRYTITAAGTSIPVVTDSIIATTISAATGLNAGTVYTLQYEFLRGDYNQDAWNTPVMAIYDTGLTLDSGASVSAPTNLFSSNMMVFGDSITAGLAQFSPYNGPTSCDGTDTYGKAMGVALQCEVGQVGKGAQGYDCSGSGNVPTLPSAWQYNWSGQARTFPTLKYLVFAEATNDYLNGISTATVQAAMQSLITTARGVVGTSCWIFLAVAMGGYYRSTTVAAVAAYKAANPSDTKVGVLDAGVVFASGFASAFGIPTQKAVGDGIHPQPEYHGQAGAAYSAQVEQIVTASSGSGSGSLKGVSAFPGVSGSIGISS